MSAWIRGCEQMNSTVYEALARSRLLRDLRRAFRDATGMSLRLVCSGVPSRDGHANAFCSLMAANAGACAACLEIQRELQSRLDRKLAPQQICCFAGMIELAVPVVVGGRHVATLLAGEVFRHKPHRRQYDRLASRLRGWGMHVRLRQMEQIYHRTPIVPEKQFQGATRLLTMFATQLAESASRATLELQGGEPPCVSQAKSFVAANVRQRVTTRQAAEHVHVSRYYFSRLFKKATGMTFSEFVARVRVENAKKLLPNPRLRITEVLDATGFNSISQFDRQFRRYAGTSPTTYRASLRV